MKNTIHFLDGANFSGRTEYLKNISREGIYLGEIPGNFLSGIMPTVQQEIKLNIKNKKWENIIPLFKSYGFEDKLNQNPFTLSGGEQVVLALLTHIMLNPSVLAIDHTLEQLSSDWRNTIMTFMNESDENISFYIADNRLDEYEAIDKVRMTQVPIIQKKYDLVFEKPDFLVYNSIEEKNNVVEFEAISFRYSSKLPWVFKNLNGKLESGKIYRLYGNNGSGKSTLSKLIYGGLKANSGKMYLNGGKIEPFKNPGKLASYSFQNPDYQFFEKNVEKEVYGNLAKHSTIDALQLLGLSNLQMMHPAELPFTIRKRIALASTICSDTPILIFDEPTLGQDCEFIEQYAGFLKKMNENGKIIIIISHSEQFISYFQDIEIINLNNNQ